MRNFLFNIRLTKSKNSCSVPTTPALQDFESSRGRSSAGQHWTPGLWKEEKMDSDSSLEDSYSNSVLQEYNTSISHIANKIRSTEFEPLKIQHYETWQDTDEDKKREWINMVFEGCRVVCGVVAPNASKELFEVIFQKNDPQVTDDLKLLMYAYRDSPSKSIKTQILSLYAYRYNIVT